MHRNYSKYVLPATGLILILVLLVVVLTDIEAHARQKLILLPVFAIGPVAIAGILGLTPVLVNHGSTFLTRVGSVMLIIAFSCLTMMLVVQQLVLMRAVDIRSALMTPQQETLDLVLETINGVQLGMDFTFDIFVGIGMLFFAWVMYAHPLFGKLIGATGILAAGYLLLSNMWAFPETPHEAGIADPAALALAWWLAVIVKEEVSKSKQPRVVAAPDEET